MGPKSTNTRKKNLEQKKVEQFLLIRDETSELLMISECKNALPVKKGARLAPDVVVSWDDNNRQRWCGPVLALGTEAHCLKIMSTIEKNSNINDTGNANSKKQKEGQLQSTITIVPRTTTEQIPIIEEENNESAEADSIGDENDKLSENEILDEEEIEKENDEEMNENESSLIQTKEVSTISKASNTLKRSSEENASSPTKKKKLSRSSLTVPYSTYSKMEQKCLALEARIALYEQEWMPRPKDPKVIQYLIEVTDILRGVHNGDDEEDFEQLMEMIMEELKMNEDELVKCNRKTATATARQIMKHIYPIPSEQAKERLKNESFLKAVIKYTRISNPADPTANVEIRHAMGNYIASIEYQNRRKNGVHLQDR